MGRRRGPLVDVLLWMRRREAGERPTMQAAHEALTAVVEGRPSGAPRPEPEPASGRRRARLIGAAVGLVVLAAAVLVGSVVLDHGETGDSRSGGQVVPGTRAAGPPSPSTAGSVVPTTAVTTSGPMSNSTMRSRAVPVGTGPACVARYRVTTVWAGGYRAEVAVVNKGGAIAGWTVRWVLPTGHTITNLWDGRLAQRGSAVTVSNLDYNGRLGANGTTVFGLTADAPGGMAVLAGTVPALTCESRPVS